MTDESTRRPLTTQYLPFYITAVQSFSQFYQACRLVFNQYHRLGYCELNPLQLRLFLQDFLSSSTALVAILDSQVVGTATAKKFCDAGLPSGTLYAPEICRLINSGKRLMESTKFACTAVSTERGVGKMSRIGSELLRAIFWWCHQMDVTDWLVVVNPRVQEFYERELGFDLIGEPRTCGHVANAPGVLLGLPVAELIVGKRDATPTARSLFLEPKMYLTSLRTPYRATPEEIAVLLLDFPELFHDASPMVQELFLREQLDLAEFIGRIHAVGKSSGQYSMTFSFAHLLGISEGPPRQTREPECFALRTMISRLLVPLELVAAQRNARFECFVDDGIPDGLVNDPELFARLFAEVGLQVLTATESAAYVLSLSHRMIDTDELALIFNAEIKTEPLRKGLVNIAQALNAELQTTLGREDAKRAQLHVFCPMFVFAGAIPLIVDQVDACLPSRTLPSLNGIRVLVVDDNPVSQVIVKRLLRRWGHITNSAGNGDEAVQLFKKEPFDLILMDIQMPTMDGFEATRAIRNIEKSCGGRIPIFAVTSFTLPSDFDRCLESGMDGYIPKPFNSQKLRDLVENVAAESVKQSDSSKKLSK